MLVIRDEQTFMRTLTTQAAIILLQFDQRTGGVRILEYNKRREFLI